MSSIQQSMLSFLPLFGLLFLSFYLRSSRSYLIFFALPLPNCSVMSPEPTNLRKQLRCSDKGFLDFVASLLTLDPEKRPTAAQALKHPWLQQELPMEPYALPA